NGNKVTPNPAIDDSNNCGGNIQIFDWASPAARVMGLKYNDGPLLADKVERYDFFRNFGGFRCPENEITSTIFAPAAAQTDPRGTGVLVSYNTAMGFLLTRNNTGANNTQTIVGP